MCIHIYMYIYIYIYTHIYPHLPCVLLAQWETLDRPLRSPKQHGDRHVTDEHPTTNIIWYSILCCSIVVLQHSNVNT